MIDSGNERSSLCTIYCPWSCEHNLSWCYVCTGVCTVYCPWSRDSSFSQWGKMLHMQQPFSLAEAVLTWPDATYIYKPVHSLQRMKRPCRNLPCKRCTRYHCMFHIPCHKLKQKGQHIRSDKTIQDKTNIRLHTNVYLYHIYIYVCVWIYICLWLLRYSPDSKVHGANMGPTWVLSAPDGPQVGPMNLAGLSLPPKLIRNSNLAKSCLPISHFNCQTVLNFTQTV